jgi:protein SCO1/2
MIALLIALSIGLDEHPGARVPTELPFTDTAGHHVHLGNIRDGDRPVVLVLAYARCRMLCNVVLRGVADAVRASHRDFTPVVISLDPHETPDEAARRRTLLGDRWSYLVGDDRSIHALADALGFRYAWDPRTEQYAHPAVVFVLSPDFRIAEYLRGVVFPGLDAAVERAARGEITPSTANDLLRCFHFDPALRRYQDKIQLAFRLGAAAIFLSLLAGLAVVIRRQRR